MAVRWRNAPNALLAAALLAAAVLLVGLTWEFTFFQDTWAILIERQGFSADAFFAPHNEHLIVFQVALEKLLIEVFGMSSARPEYLVMVATLLASASMVYVYIRRRTDPWLALMAAALLLFLGSAWQVQLWPFEIDFVVPLAFGLGAVLVLERESRGADAWACALLVLALGFGSLGIAFMGAALVDVLLKRRRRGVSRIWIVAVPLLLYVVWYAGWGHDAEHHLTLKNILNSPPYVLNGFATAVGSLSGLSASNVTAAPAPDWGRILLVVLVGAAIHHRWRRPLPSTFWPIAAAALAYWFLAAFNFIPGREATAPRYVYTGAAFVLLLAAEIWRDARPGPRVLLACAIATGFALMPNLVQMKEGADFLRDQSVLTRADTGAIDIAERTVAPSFALTPEIAGTPSLINVNAEDYLAAVRDHGSPGYSPSELERASQAARRQADIVLASALPISSSVRAGAYATVGAPDCIEVAGVSSPEVPLSSGLTRIELAPGPAANLELRRFADGEFPVVIGESPGGSTTLLRIPADRASQPWLLRVGADQPARVCGSAG